MQPGQIYETLIFDRESGAGISLVTIPEHSLPWDVKDPVRHVVESLGLEEVREVPGDRLPEVIEEILAHPEEVRSTIKPTASGLGNYLWFEPLIPVAKSPVGGRSLGELGADTGVLTVAFLHGDPVVILMALGTLVFAGPLRVAGKWGTRELAKILNVPDD